MKLRRAEETGPGGPEYVATFLAQASSEVTQEVLGDILGNLKLWAELKSPEDVALHNAALRIVAKMNAAQSLNPKSPTKHTLVIVHERQEDAV